MYNMRLQHKFLKKQSMKEDDDPLVEEKVPSVDEWVVGEENVEETSLNEFLGANSSKQIGSWPAAQKRKRNRGKGMTLQLVDEEPEWDDITSDDEDDGGIRYNDDTLEDDNSDDDEGDETLDPHFMPLDTNDSLLRD